MSVSVSICGSRRGSVRQLTCQTAMAPLPPYRKRDAVSTLNERLRGLMTTMVRRRMCQSAKQQRTQILQNTMGRTRYFKASDLVRDIRMAKMNQVMALRCDGDMSSRTFGMNLPPVVRNLYFETSLVHAFEQYGLERLPTVDWDRLIEQAELNLLEFQRWFREESNEAAEPA